LDIGCRVHASLRLERLGTGERRIALVTPLGIAVQRAPLRRIPSLAGGRRSESTAGPVATLLRNVHFIVRSASWVIWPRNLRADLGAGRAQGSPRRRPPPNTSLQLSTSLRLCSNERDRTRTIQPPCPA